MSISVRGCRLIATCAATICVANPALAALVAHWSLDEPAGTTGVDSVMDSTTLYHGTPTGGVTFGLPGANANTGTAAEFDGVDAVIDIPFAQPLNPQSFTVTAWALPDTDAGGFNSVLTNREDLFPDLGGFVIYNSSAGDWQFWTGPGVGAGGWDVVTGPPVFTGFWQHVAITYDDSTGIKSLYVDGFLEAEAAGGYFPNASRDLHIGSGGDQGTEFRFDGLIDDVALFDEALTEQEINDIMDNGISASGPQNLAVEIDRDSGNIRLTNPTNAISFDITGYSLLSDAGGLNPDGWLAIAANDNNWNIFASTDTELGEGTLSATTIAPGEEIDLGNAWRASPFEDVTTEIALGDGSVIGAALCYVGNDGESFAIGDLNTDGAIDTTDWQMYRDGYRADLSSLTLVAAYQMGDLNSDGENNVVDFGMFKLAFDAANGAGSFAALGSVPEPAAWIIVLLAALSMAARRRIRTCTTGHLALVAVLVAIPFTAKAELPSIVAHWPLDGDATDVVGGNDGIEFEVLYGPGANANTDMAADFDSFFQATIDVPYSEQLNPESFTVSLWAFPLVTGDGMFRSPITSRDDQFGATGDTYGFIIYNDSGGNWNFWTGPGEGNGLWNTLGAGPVTESEWVHLAVSFDAPSQTKSFFVDGSLAAQSTTQSYGQNGLVGQKNLHIGSGADLGDQFFFDGSVDDVAIYNGVLTQAEIVNVMDNGAAAFDLLRLKLEIDKNDGTGTLSNNAGVDIDIDQYEIFSGSGALNADGWASLEDQDYEGSGGSGTGDGWEELGSPDTSFVAEAFLQGSSVVGPDTSIDLGSLFNPFGGEDLLFTYRLATGAVIEGIVEYSGMPPELLPGDYDGDNFVGQGDIDLVLLNWGQAGDPPPQGWTSNLPEGNVDQGELDAVLLNWGDSLAVPGGASAVPEPATWVLLIAALAALGLTCRRK